MTSKMAVFARSLSTKIVKHEKLLFSHFSMAEVMAGFSCSILLIIFFCGTEIFARQIYTNVWAVKVRGSRQEVEEIALKYGFSYDTHVSANERFIRDRRRLPRQYQSNVIRSKISIANITVYKCAKQESVRFVLCPKQGPKIEDVVLHR